MNIPRQPKLIAAKLFATTTVVFLWAIGPAASAQTQVQNEYRTPVTVFSPVKESGADLTSAIEKSVDYLQKQIDPPSNQTAGTTAGFLSDSKTKQKAIKTGATLTLVLSVFLTMVVFWRMRPGSTKTTTRRRRRVNSNQPIPESVVSVLGQLPFVHNQQLQLLRLGSSLLLVSVSANGSQTLGEINNPDEVHDIQYAFETGQFERLAARFQNLDHPTSAQPNGHRPTNLSLGSQPNRSQLASTGRTLLEA